jgi:hypothetical protein
MSSSSSSSSRSCLIEEGSVQTTFDALLRDRSPAQVGLMLGKLEVGARDFIVALVPSPDKNDGGGDDDDVGGSNSGDGKGSKKKGTAAAAGDKLEIDEDWLVEHSLQVSRMLPGKGCRHSRVSGWLRGPCGPSSTGDFAHAPYWGYHPGGCQIGCVDHAWVTTIGCVLNHAK